MHGVCVCGNAWEMDINIDLLRPQAKYRSSTLACVPLKVSLTVFSANHHGHHSSALGWLAG